MAENKIKGSIQAIDASGNLVTSIPADALVNVPRGVDTIVMCDEHETHGIFTDYSGQPPMTLVAVIGGSGNLELTIVGDSAAIMLGVTVGTPVTISW